MSVLRKLFRRKRTLNTDEYLERELRILCTRMKQERQASLNINSVRHESKSHLV